MEENKSSITARVSAFSRAYHAKNSKVKVFDDGVAEKLLSPEEYEQIANNMAKGIHYFNPTFKGTDKEALDFVVNHQLAPTPVGRGAFTESKLSEVVKMGARQYCIFAAGFDSFAYRQPDYAKGIQIFEIDHPATSVDKQERVSKFCKEPIHNLHYIQADFTEADWGEQMRANESYNEKAVSFCSLLGISYYLSRQDFERLLQTISKLVPTGSSLVFDYPTLSMETMNQSDKVKKQEDMAGASGEAMLAKYTREEMRQMLLKYGFIVKEDLQPDEITERFFKEYNATYPRNPMKAFNEVDYCYAILEKH